MCSPKDLYKNMAALFIRTPNWKQLKCSMTTEWINGCICLKWNPTRQWKLMTTTRRNFITHRWLTEGICNYTMHHFMYVNFKNRPKKSRVLKSVGQRERDKAGEASPSTAIFLFFGVYGDHVFICDHSRGHQIIIGIPFGMFCYSSIEKVKNQGPQPT